jgi:MOSC domain-containing protein YiiM
MTTLPQADLPQDHGILRTAARHNQPYVPASGSAMPSVGVYANVLHSGTIRRNDPVRIQPAVALREAVTKEDDADFSIRIRDRLAEHWWKLSYAALATVDTAC